MNTKLKSAMTAIFLGCSLANPCLALTAFNNFTDTSSLKLNGATATVTTTDGVILRLTPANGNQAGSVFSQVPVNAATFSTFFKFRITESGGMGDGGADGIVFVIQPISSDLGGTGGEIGYGGIGSSVGVEFDTWDNGEISASHIGIDLNGRVNHEGGVVNTTPKLDDGNIWFAWIDYDGATLEVRANQTGTRPLEVTLSQKLDLPTILGGVTQAFVGFTSGTGGAFSNHDILSWEYRESFEPIGSPTPVTPPPTSPTVAKTIELCTAIDASGSIETTDFQLQLNGLANAIEDPTVIPPDSTITLSVVQFSSTATIAEKYGVAPTVIDSQTTAQTVANQIRAFKKFEGGTNIQAGIELCAKQFTFKADKQVIDISTDGQASVSKEFLENLMANGVDAINALGVGNGVDQTRLAATVRPQPPCTILGQANCGFVLLIEDFTQYEEAIKKKIAAETGTPVVAEIPAPTLIAIAEGPCPPTEGYLDWHCNAGWQTIHDLDNRSHGNLSSAVLEGTITNNGWVSNLNIQPGSAVNGGTVTGYIKNQGTVSDFEFRGASLIGGTLAGNIQNNSIVGGFFQDVQLAPNTHLKGGSLRGNIKGDKNAPAVLEDVVVKAGSYLSGVTLGKNVTLEKGVTVEEAKTVQPTTTPELPSLGGTMTTDANGKTVQTKTTIAGGISIDGGDTFQSTQTVQSLSDMVDIQGLLTIDPTQIGQPADILVYLTYQSSAESTPVYLMLGTQGSFLPWDGKDMAALVAFQQVEALASKQPVEIYRGMGLSLSPGLLKFHLGYRLKDGTIVFSAKAMEVTVTE